MKIIIFRGYLTDDSAKKEALVCISDVITKMKINVFGLLWSYEYSSYIIISTDFWGDLTNVSAKALGTWLCPK